MARDTWEPDLFGALATAAAGVARTLRKDAASAVLFWGDPPEVEVVHKDGLPDDVTRALSAGGGTHLADAVRRAGRPMRVRTDALPQAAISLAAALRAHGLAQLALFPLLGELGIVGCIVVPLDSEPPRQEADGAAWRAACRSLAGLQVAAGAAALRCVLEGDRRRPVGPCDGVVVVDRWERVLLADGLVRDLPGWNRADPFGRSLYHLPGGALLAGVCLSKAGAPEAEEHIFPPAEHQGVPVALTAFPGRLLDGRPDGSKVILVRDLRPAKASHGDGTARVLALAIRVAHAAEEFVRGSRGDIPSGGPVWGVSRLLEEARAVPELVRTVLRETADEGHGGQMDLNQAVASVLERVRGELEVERVRVFTFLRPDVDPVPGDPLEVLSALRVLVARARASLRLGGGTLTVRTWVEDGWAGIAVSDDGAGVAPASSVACFEPLFHGGEDEWDRDLEEVRNWAKRRGGRFQVERRPKVWNRYTIMLPLERRADSGAPSSSETVVRRTSDGKLEVLVVDDNAALRSVLRRFLERRGHAVTEAVDGDDALGKVSARPFDRVIVDIQMPGKNGTEFFDCLAKVAPEMQARTLFMTGGIQEDSIERFIEESGRPAISKPFDLAELAKTLEG